MGPSLRRLHVGLLVTLAWVMPAAARPTIAVHAQIDPRDVHLIRKLTRDLSMSQSGSTPETFLAERFIETFSQLQLFTFVTSTPAASTPNLTLVVTSGDDTLRWPFRDVQMSLEMSGQRPIRFVLFRRAECGSPPCAPASLADTEWYRERFTDLIKQWPNGLFREVVFSTRATYAKRGIVRTAQSIQEFGQPPGGPPTALFELAFGEYQREFALCLDHADEGGWLGLGRDQQRSIIPTPNCYPPPPQDSVPTGVVGRVTLLRGFLP